MVALHIADWLVDQDQGGSATVSSFIALARNALVLGSEMSGILDRLISRRPNLGHSGKWQEAMGTKNRVEAYFDSGVSVEICQTPFCHRLIAHGMSRIVARGSIIRIPQIVLSLSPAFGSLNCYSGMSGYVFGSSKAMPNRYGAIFRYLIAQHHGIEQVFHDRFGCEMIEVRNEEIRRILALLFPGTNLASRRRRSFEVRLIELHTRAQMTAGAAASPNHKRKRTAALIEPKKK